MNLDFMLAQTTTIGRTLADKLGALLVPFLIVMAAVAFVIVVKVMASRWKKIPPNAVGIFYGRKYAYVDPADSRLKKRGFRIVAGGGSLLLPIVENLQLMSTAAFQTDIQEENIPNRDNVKVNVKGVATCKISAAPEDLHNAAMAFLGKDEAEIKMFVCNILIGHLRSIIGKLNIDEILRQRDAFNKQVVQESAEELKRLGIQIITLVIQDVNDVYGYIDALGQKTVAEAKRDASIKVAEAEAETQKKTSDAHKEASVVVANNAVVVAEAERDRDVKRAQFKVVADSEKARADQALAIATADQERTLRVKQAERDAAEKEAQIKVQEKETSRRQQELNATVVMSAEAARKQAVIEADAAKSVAVLRAEAERESAVRRAEGEKQANVLEGEGEASKTRATLTARAEGEAAIKRQALLAEAEGQAAMKGKVLLAEAEGTAKLAEALAKMTDAAKLIMILDRLPRLIELTGEAGEKIAHATFTGVAAPLGNVDSIHIVDLGGSGKGLDQLASLVPNTVVKTIATLKATGIDLEGLAKKAGVDISAISKMLGPGLAGTQPGAEPAAGSGEVGAHPHAG